MAEDLKCVSMTTPKYRGQKRSWHKSRNDQMRRTHDSIAAHGVLGHCSGDLDPVVKDSGDYQGSQPHHHSQDPIHHYHLPPPPWGVRDLRSTSPPSPYSHHPCNPFHNHQGLPGGRLFGTPTFSAKSDRAAQFGIQPPWMEASFEGNQSFPKVSRPRRSRPDPKPGNITMNPAATLTAGPKLEALQGDGMNDISFASSQPRKKYFPRLKDTSPQPVNTVPTVGSGKETLTESWSFSRFLGSVSQTSSALPSTVRNPNKAICTIVESTSEILTANDMACDLFGYEESQLVGRTLKDLLRVKSKEQEAIKECHLEPSGQIISLAGKVVEVLDSQGLSLPVSLWVKRLDTATPTTSTTTSPTSSQHPQEGDEGGGVRGRKSVGVGEESRLLCVMEPVERTVGHVTFDALGEIQWCDDHMAQLCGYAGPHQVSGLHLTQLIPAFHFPDPVQGLTKEVKKQRATGRTRDGMSFPLSIMVRPQDDVDIRDGRWIPPGQEGLRDMNNRPLYRATVWVFANISGLISIRPDGTIHSLNENFARLLFGYNRSELIGHSISKLIPDFFDILEMESDPAPLPPLDDKEIMRKEEEKESKKAETQTSQRATTLGAVMGDICCTPIPSPREMGRGRGRLSPCTSTPNTTSQPTTREDLAMVPMTSKPCITEEIEEEEGDSVVSESSPTSSSSGSHASQRKWGTSSQKEIFPSTAEDKKPDLSSLVIHNASCLSSSSLSSTSYTDISSRHHHSRHANEEEEIEDGPDKVHLDGMENEAGVTHVCLRSFSDNAQNVIGQRWASALYSNEDFLGSVPLNEDAGIGQEGKISLPGRVVIDHSFCGHVENKKTELNHSRDKGERNWNNSNRKQNSGFSANISGCQDSIVRQTEGMLSGERSLGKQEGVRYSSPDPILICRGDFGAADFKDIEVDVFDHCHGDEKSSNRDGPPPSMQDDVCAMLSPIKSAKPHLFSDSFCTQSFANQVDDDKGSDNDDVDVSNDATADLLAACEASGVWWSDENEDTGDGSSSGHGVLADVSGNMEESTSESGRLNLEHGQMSRLSHADAFSLHTKLFQAAGLVDSSSSSTEEDLSGPPEPLLTQGVPPHRLHDLDSSACDSATYLEDESSYFSRDGASLFKAASDSAGSPSSTGCVRGISDSSLKDLSAEGERRAFADAATNVSGEAGIRAETSPLADAGPKVRCQGHIPEGSFSGQGRHKDGGTLSIMFQIRRVVLMDGSHMLLLWLSRDPEDACLDASRSHGNLTLASSLCSTLDQSLQSQHSLGELLQEQANSDSKREDIQEGERQDYTTTTSTTVSATKRQSITNISRVEDDDNDHHAEKDDDEKNRHEVSTASAGEFSKNYMALSSIGKGAFGFVKLARRLRDGQEVVVKFIRRAKVLRDSWVKDPNSICGSDLIPMEVYLLVRLNHPNIVKVLDVYQNSDFIQLVMERHGSGMDLFEFIDRNPVMDEPLTSYIFRQMVAGVAYLHSQNVVHRDIKDENIIIDERFRIKLIDFGAAAYMLPGRMFATFCGTIEYCSPEVLSGNKYRGPELEMWSLGITLYTLIFGENPFFDVEETLQGVLKPPATVSRALMFLITWLLQPDPLFRATISDVERNAWVNQPIEITQYQWETVLPNTEFCGNTACDNREDSTSSSVLHGHPNCPSTLHSDREHDCDSIDNFSAYTTAKDISSALSSVNTSVQRSHSSAARTPHSSADSDGSGSRSNEGSGYEGETTMPDHSALYPHSDSSSDGEGSRRSRFPHSSRAESRIVGVAPDLDRLLQLHGGLDEDYSDY